MKAAKLEIGIRSQESGARRKESEGRRKKCFCKYEMLPESPLKNACIISIPPAPE
ncbi:hypothetical protein [Microcoleus sp. D2_18a_B4]|uniref:hypothetical protein n=1 Tax=Microcoleus sp. D2_18a_B4 TaxID=3055329 RepID=UPI002FD1FBB8